jgi:hypothetical protein
MSPPPVNKICIWGRSHTQLAQLIFNGSGNNKKASDWKECNYLKNTRRLRRYEVLTLKLEMSKLWPWIFQVVVSLLIRSYLSLYKISHGRCADLHVCYILIQLCIFLPRSRIHSLTIIWVSSICCNFALLEESERRLHHLNQFHYRFTQNNNPLRRETSGRTENGNTVAHTQDPAQNERHDGADLSRLSTPRPREARDARTNRPGAKQSEKRPSRSSHQLSSREPVPAQPSASSSTNPPPEEPRQPSSEPQRSTTCGN